MGRSAYAYPVLAWRWRDLARVTLVTWLDADGLNRLCLGQWLEGILDGVESTPPLVIGQRVGGFGLADIAGIWQRAEEHETGEAPGFLDTTGVTELRQALAACRDRLTASPVMRMLQSESRYTSSHARETRAETFGRQALATLVRYAEQTAADGAKS
jgi:hypothetical protein